MSAAPSTAGPRPVRPGHHAADIVAVDAHRRAGGRYGGTSSIHANITQSDWLTVMKNRACVGCHQMGQLSTRTIPAAPGEFTSSEAAWIRRVRSGQAANFMLNPLTGPLGSASFKYSAIGPIASPRASCRPASRRGPKASSATSSSRRERGGSDEIPPRSDRLGSALSDGQCLRPALRLARMRLGRRPDPRSQDAHFLSSRARPSPPETELRDHERGGPGTAPEGDPLGRYAEPEDLSAAVRFLPGARHITGATLDVNGGYVMV